jgi:predicted negative regulator of RcsB-dependent stress response
MRMNNIKLFDKKRIAIIVFSLIGGVAYFLGYRYYQSGAISTIDIISAIMTLMVSSVIAFVIIRHANKDE